MARLLPAICAVLVLFRCSEGHEASVLRDGPPGQQVPDIATMIKDLNMCFLQPGGNSTPVTIHSKLFGDVKVWQLCCENTTIAGLNLTMQPIEPGDTWAGATMAHFTLQQLETHCVADWQYRSVKGKMAFALGTVGQGSLKPFIDLGVSLTGVPISADGIQYPWPGKVSSQECAVNFNVSGVKFFGDIPTWAKNILNAGARVGQFIQRPLRALVCPFAKLKVPRALNKVLAQAREAATPYIQRVADDAGPPEKPSGSGQAYDLRTAKPLSWLHSLALQGVEFDGLNDLVRRITAGRDSATVQLGQHGLEVAKINLTTVPSDLDLAVRIMDVGLEGVATIEQLSIRAEDAAAISVKLGQRHMNVSTKIRTLTSMREESQGSLGVFFEQLAEDDASRNLTRVMGLISEYLIENFELSLALSDVQLNTRVGMLWDVNQTEYLTPSSSWQAPQCMTSMIQNASVTHMGLDVVVEQFRFDSVVTRTDQLEREFDNCVNSLMAYLNMPQMKRTVSRLIQSIAAGVGRDIANKQIQTVLTMPPAEPCVAEIGFGSWTVFNSLLALGAVLLVAALASLLCCLCSKCRSRVGLRFSALLACSGFVMFMASQSGWPFGAVFRMHDGQASGGWAAQDFLLNVYVVEMSDMLKYMPGTMAVVGASTLLWQGRCLAIVGLAVFRTGRIHVFFAKLVRVLGALAGWGLAMLFMVCIPQVVSFYARLLQFGDVWVDMGVVLRPSFYLMPLCFTLCDIASIVAYRSTGTSKVMKYSRPPSLIVLVCLFLSLVVLVASPFLTLWTHTYGGVLGKTAHYQYDGGVEREVSIWSVLEHAHQWIANPAELGVGLYIVLAVIFVNVVLAPIANAALSLYAGIRVRQHGTAYFHSRRLNEGIRSRQASSFVSICGETPSLTGAPLQGSASGEPPRIVPTAGASLEQETASEAGAGLDLVTHRGTDCLAWSLVVARMWSGADAFALFMAVIVPELGQQLRFMSAQACEHLDDVLGRLDQECMTLHSDLNVGLLTLGLAAFAARVLSELAAHGPLRGSLIPGDSETLLLEPEVVSS